MFGPQADGGGAASFALWLSDLATAVENVLHNGDDIFGDTLLSLEVGMSDNVTAAWLNASDDETSPRYLDMSRRIQTKLKQLIPFVYFQNPEKFENRSAAASLLVYSAIPPSTQISLSNGKLTLNQPTGIFWDFLDPQKLEAMVNNKLTANNLSTRMQRVFERLQAIEGFESLAKEYDPKKRVDVVIAAAENDPGDGLHKLLRVESMTARLARAAGVNMARFKKSATVEPTEARVFLEEFGAKFTDAFNVELSGLHGGFKSRPLGTLLLIEAALALDPSLSADDVKMNAILELIVLTAAAKFKPADYLDGAAPPKEEIVIQQRIVSL